MSMIVSPLYKIIYSTLFFFYDRLCIIQVFYFFDDVIGTDFPFEGYSEMRLAFSVSYLTNLCYINVIQTQAVLQLFDNDSFRIDS